MDQAIEQPLNGLDFGGTCASSPRRKRLPDVTFLQCEPLKQTNTFVLLTQKNHGHPSKETRLRRAALERSGRIPNDDENRSAIVRLPAFVARPLVPPPAPPQVVPVPRVHFREKRSVEAADLPERDEQARAVCNVREDPMDDEIDWERHRPNITCGTGRRKRRSRQQDACRPRVTSADARHQDLLLIMIVRDECSSEPISATRVDKRSPDAKVKCRNAWFQNMGSN